MRLNCGAETCSKSADEGCQFLYENPLTGKSYCMKFNKQVVAWTYDGWLERLPECVAEEPKP